MASGDVTGNIEMEGGVWAQGSISGWPKLSHYYPSKISNPDIFPSVVAGMILVYSLLLFIQVALSFLRLLEREKLVLMLKLDMC